MLNFYKKYISLLILTFIGFGNFILGAQNLEENTSDDKSDTTWQLVKYDTKQTLKSVGHSFTRPLHWKGKDYAKLGGLLVGTLAVSTLDDETNNFFLSNRDGFPRPIRDFGWYFGSPQNYFMANAGLYGFGLFTKNEKIRKTSILIISSSITSGLIQTTLKTAVGRARPGGGFDSTDFDPFSPEGSHHSFPSGHTVLSVTMAHAIAKQFDNTWAKIGIYSIGAIPPISRLVDDAHWLSDIAFSAALSIIVVDGIDKFLFNTKAYDYSKPPKKISWNFTFSANQVGFIGSF